MLTETRILAELKAKREAHLKAQAPLQKQLLEWIESFELPVLEIESPHKEYIKSKFEYFKNWAKGQTKKDSDSLMDSMLKDANNIVQQGIKKVESDNQSEE